VKIKIEITPLFLIQIRQTRHFMKAQNVRTTMSAERVSYRHVFIFKMADLENMYMCL